MFKSNYEIVQSLVVQRIRAKQNALGFLRAIPTDLRCGQCGPSIDLVFLQSRHCTFKHFITFHPFVLSLTLGIAFLPPKLQSITLLLNERNVGNNNSELRYVKRGSLMRKAGPAC